MLLSRLPVDVDTVTDVSLRGRLRRGGLRLPGHYHFVPRFPRWGTRQPRLVGIAQTAANVGLAIAAGLLGARIARRRRSRWVLSVADDGFSVIAGSVAARLSRRPHLVWVFDPWEENLYGPAERWLAVQLERRIWSNAAAVIVHSPEMARHFASKHGVRCDVLPTPVDVAAWDGIPARDRPARDGRREILVAGALYWLQSGAVRRLAEACRRLDGVELALISAPELMQSADLNADRFEGWLPPDRFRARLRQADALFLGLSFDSGAPLAAHTSAPARLPEYLASETPLLIHAPADSHVAQYARQEGFGVLVDRADVQAVVDGVREVLDDGATAARRATAGRRLAAERHDVRCVAEKLAEVLARASGPASSV